MEWKPKKSRARREAKRALQMAAETAAKRALVMLVLFIVTLLLVKRPVWAVKAVRVLIDVAKGAGV